MGGPDSGRDGLVFGRAAAENEQPPGAGFAVLEHALGLLRNLAHPVDFGRRGGVFAEAPDLFRALGVKTEGCDGRRRVAAGITDNSLIFHSVKDCEFLIGDQPKRENLDRIRLDGFRQSAAILCGPVRACHNAVQRQKASGRRLEIRRRNPSGY